MKKYGKCACNGVFEAPAYEITRFHWFHVGYAAAVINCEDSPKWDGSEGLLIEPFQKGLFDGHRFLENDEPDGSDTEVWCTFNMPKGDELPSVEDAKQYAGFVITGSHYSATQNDDWVLRLSQWIKDVAEYSASQSGHHPRILAICFGAQVTARALGGEVGKNPSRRMVAKVSTYSHAKS